MHPEISNNWKPFLLLDCTKDCRFMKATVHENWALGEGTWQLSTLSTKGREQENKCSGHCPLLFRVFGHASHLSNPNKPACEKDPKP